jgi:hypothetical protein
MCINCFLGYYWFLWGNNNVSSSLATPIGSCVETGAFFSLVGNFESFLCMDIGVEMNKNGKGWLWDVKVMVFPPRLKILSTLEKWKKGEEEGQRPKWISKYKSIASNELRLNKRKRSILAPT